MTESGLFKHPLRPITLFININDRVVFIAPNIVSMYTTTALDTSVRSKSTGAAVAELVREAILCGEFAEGATIAGKRPRSKIWNEQNSAAGGSADSDRRRTGQGERKSRCTSQSAATERD